MIAFREVTAAGFRRASFELAPGGLVRLALSSAADLDALLGLILGALRPAAGEVVLFGRPLAACSEDETLALLRRIGFVWGRGGFLSNLKVWENIQLPLWYHEGRSAAVPEQTVDDVLGRLGVEPERRAAFLASLPGSLPAREQRFIGMVRTVLKDPEVVLYAGILEGLDDATRGRFLELAAWFHARRPGRISVYAAAGTQGLPALPGAIGLRQGADGGIAPWD